MHCVPKQTAKYLVRLFFLIIRYDLHWACHTLHGWMALYIHQGFCYTSSISEYTGITQNLETAELWLNELTY